MQCMSTQQNLLLVSKRPGQDNLFLSGGVLDLKGTVLEEILDAGWHGLVLLDILLELNLVGQLGGELLIRLASRRSEED